MDAQRMVDQIRGLDERSKGKMLLSFLIRDSLLLKDIQQAKDSNISVDADRLIKELSEFDMNRFLSPLGDEFITKNFS